MKVLITGGAGYVGHSLTQSLSRSRSVSSIIIYDNLSRGNYSVFTSASFGETPVTFVRGELLDNHGLAESLVGVDVVVHLAARVTTPYADRDAHAFDQINHWGTANLGRAITQSDVKRVIYLSSVSVYGSSDEAVDENYDPQPTSFYGISKLAGEHQLAPLKRDRELCIIRSGNVYGFNPGFRIDALINRFVFEAHTAGRILIYGNGEGSRSFIHIRKLSDLITSIIDDGLEAGIYNAVEHNLTIREAAQAVFEIYPGTEHLLVSQTMPMRRIRISTPCRVFGVFPLADMSLRDELLEFQQALSLEAIGHD